MSKINPLWYRFARSTVRHTFFRFLGPIRVLGKENIPRLGPLLIAPNHVSYLDPPLIGCVTPRILRFMAKEELFRKKWFGKLLRSLGTFPVKRGQNDTESIRKALDILTQGEALLIFPEGIRGNGIQLNPINPGVAMLAKRTGAQILPVGIIGTHIAWPAGAKKIQRAPMTVIFGKPFSYEEVAQGTTEREKREHFSSELSQRILELCRQGGLELQAPFSGALPVEN